MSSRCITLSSADMKIEMPLQLDKMKRGLHIFGYDSSYLLDCRMQEA